MQYLLPVAGNQTSPALLFLVNKIESSQPLFNQSQQLSWNGVIELQAGLQRKSVVSFQCLYSPRGRGKQVASLTRQTRSNPPRRRPCLTAPSSLGENNLLAGTSQVTHTSPYSANDPSTAQYMPADYTIDAERGVVFSRGTGVFTHKDYIEQVEALGKDSLFQSKFCQLVDCRSITQMKLTADEIEDLARRSVFEVNSLRAFVVADTVQYGLSRMLGTYRKIHGGQEIRVFTELKEALIWLGLPGDLDPYAKKDSIET